MVPALTINSWAAKAALWRGAEGLGLSDLAEAAVRPHGWGILWGHGICADAVCQLEHYPRDIHVSVFRAQMEYLLDHGYRFVSMSEGIRRLRTGLPMDRMMTLTFDDGYRNVIELAYPIMVELRLKGCLYVIAELVNSDRYLWTDMVDLVCLNSVKAGGIAVIFPDGRAYLPIRSSRTALKAAGLIKQKLRALPDATRIECFGQIEEAFSKVPPSAIPRDYAFVTWDHLKSLDPQILEVGNHTLSHPNLASISDAEILRREISCSRTILEAQLGFEVEHFCYPAGSYDADVIQEVKRARHVSAVTTEYGLNQPGDSLFELKRLGLPATLAHFKARVSGLEALALNARRILHV
jgi:peptidoglycan/xylan/chitin deacetylase (PgdA/CDA1 family)